MSDGELQFYRRKAHDNANNKSLIFLVISVFNCKMKNLLLQKFSYILYYMSLMPNDDSDFSSVFIFIIVVIDRDDIAVCSNYSTIIRDFRTSLMECTKCDIVLSFYWCIKCDFIISPIPILSNPICNCISFIQ